jgi:hypothetical protein
MPLEVRITLVSDPVPDIMVKQTIRVNSVLAEFMGWVHTSMQKPHGTIIFTDADGQVHLYPGSQIRSVHIKEVAAENG